MQILLCLASKKKFPDIQESRKTRPTMRRKSDQCKHRMICLLELANLSVKTVIIVIFHMFEKLEKLLNIVIRNIKDISYLTPKDEKYDGWNENYTTGWD